MRARFLDAESAAAAVREGRPFPYGRRQWQHWFRRWSIRVRGHLFPFNRWRRLRAGCTGRWDG